MVQIVAEERSETNEKIIKIMFHIFFCYDRFCTQLSNFFWVQFRSKMILISKDTQCSDRSFRIHEFFCAILVFEI